MLKAQKYNGFEGENDLFRRTLCLFFRWAKRVIQSVRDSFTIPKAEYEVLEGLKDRAANLKRPTKKSELLRAGVVALQGMTDKAFLSVLNGVPSLKTGRPKGPGAEKKKTTGTDA